MPPLLREVLDSEDEEEMSPVKSRNDQADPTLSSGEIVPAVDLNNTSERGSGSTDEQLRRAHLDLMAPTQDAIDVAVPVSSTSPLLTRTKRRLTGSDDLPPPSSARQAKRTKTDVPIVTSSEATVPGPTLPDTFYGTGDTIAGATIPSMQVLERQTPAKSTRKPSTPSDDKSVSLTPWTVSAFSSSDQRKDHSASSGEKASQPRLSAQKPKLPSSDHLGSDDMAAIGLPKEQYKPRPSRSRSTQIAVEPIDYSVRPEKKAKVKRNATTGSPMKPSGSNPFPENPVLDSPNFEALSPPPETAKPGIKPDGATDNSTHPEAIPEMAPPATKAQPKKAAAKKAAAKSKPKQYGKRGRPKKVPEVVISDDEDEDELAHDPNPTTADPNAAQVEVQVIISPQNLTPATEQQPTIEDSKAQQDLASDIVARLRQAEPLPSKAVAKENNKDKKQTGLPPPPKAVGRRGKKPQPPPIVEKENNDPEPKDPESIVESEETSKSLDLAPAQEDSPADQEDKKTSTPAPQAALKVPAVGAKISPLPDKKPQTPLSRYRVGLSRTQQIPSLLRIFKK